MSEIRPYYLKTFDRHDADKLAVERGEKPHLRFNKKLGMMYVTIIQQLKHYKGAKAGENIALEDWQKKAIAILFGWQRQKDDGTWVRRFRTAFVFMPRKNGKTIFGSASAIADMIVRHDQGGEVAFFATKKDQAKLAYAPAKYMLENHTDLKKHTKESYGRIKFDRSDTELYTLGRDSDTLDGLNVSFGLADEHHAHKDDSLWDVVKSSQMARREPFMMSITTAGFNIASPAYALYEYSKKVLDGVIEDDTLFAFIAEAPEKPKNDPDWYFKEEVWKAANPNYGVSVDPEEFALAAKEAYDRPEKLNNFLVKYLNVWTTSAESYLPLSKWIECAGEVEHGGRVIGGMDLSWADDFSAYAKVSKIDEKFHISVKMYAPKDNLADRERELKAPLVSWANEGYITATPGSTINYDYIKRDIVNDLGDMEAFCYDPYKAKSIVHVLEDEEGYENCMPIRQGFISLSEPTVYFSKLIKDGLIVHDGNPVLTWMISNVSILTDAAGNIKPDKSNNNKKIDGVAAIINTFAYLIHDTADNNKSVYEERGMRSL
ncbi:terminase large subunit [Sulfurovum mangrovi]|uniref:terminase large subunit n=1 Tax=Sulfurovum mangrovi TaxID=2893889 RepID=UPI001E4C582A|nr:terminase TerL endonuclease subunit [Sulfurovum mangrovi]UFH59826.1 terminase large subunit [Sulfurovum mangrovi]UFH59877.1 terminase large subunit [Sulfurovum mangrovi]